MSDPYFANVTLLCINDSQADASTSFADQSLSAQTITANGDFQYDTAQAPSGLSSSGLADGTGDYLFIASNAGFGFGTADFTLEFHWRYNVNSATVGIK
jgi:hypothetical protein